MPWRQVDAMTERWQFIVHARQRLVTFTDLCALHGISRVTGYKWLERARALRQEEHDLLRPFIRLCSVASRTSSRSSRLPVGRGRWRFLAVVLDQSSRRVLAWTLRGRRDAHLTCAVLEAAVRRRPHGVASSSTVIAAASARRRRTMVLPQRHETVVACQRQLVCPAM